MACADGGVHGHHAHGVLGGAEVGVGVERDVRKEVFKTRFFAAGGLVFVERLLKRGRQSGGLRRGVFRYRRLQ